MYTSSREDKNTLYNNYGDQRDYEDFEKCTNRKIEGSCSSINKKWRESNWCIS